MGNFNTHFISLHGSLSTSSHNLTALHERLQNFLTQAGYGSCLACEDFVPAGQVFLNGKGVEFGQKVNPTVDKITADGELSTAADSLISITLYNSATRYVLIRVLEIMIVPLPTILPKICCSYHLPINLSIELKK